MHCDAAYGKEGCKVNERLNNKKEAIGVVKQQALKTNNYNDIAKCDCLKVNEKCLSYRKWTKASFQRLPIKISIC